MTDIKNITDREIALKARVAELEQERDHAQDFVESLKIELSESQVLIEASRKQMESQKDEWLSWNEKRTALEKDAERYRFIYEKSCQVGYGDETLVFYIRNQSKLDDRIQDAKRAFTAVTGGAND